MRKYYINVEYMINNQRTFSHGVGLIAAKHLAKCWTAFEKNNFSSATILPTVHLPYDSCKYRLLIQLTDRLSLFDLSIVDSIFSFVTVRKVLSFSKDW